MSTTTIVTDEPEFSASTGCDADHDDLAPMRVQSNFASYGEQMYELMVELFPICRSITGDGFRQTQDILREQLPDLQLRAVPSGTKCFDWTVPPEWNIRDAYILDPNGRKILDFQECNLHVVNYSTAIDTRMSLEELRPHLHTLPEKPELIPYRTSYYQRDWGFCLTHQQYEQLPAGTYWVVIDSSLDDNGCLNYGEYFLPGETEQEVLLSSHACHPSLCNDNLSGVVVATHLAKLLATVKRRYSYRFLFGPGGIGSVVWLSQNQHRLDRIKHGLVLTCLGDPANFTYKRTRAGNALIDQAAMNVLKNSGKPFRAIDFSPYGYDERNYNSCKYQLPVGSLSRSQYGEYYGYHSSGDNLELVSAERLAESLEMYWTVLEVLEGNATYINTIPEAEPQLGKRGLYGMMGGLQGRDRMELVFLWLMNFSDGEHSLLDISDRSGYTFALIQQGADILCDHGLLRPVC
jgi:aminopeptidase-like protein